MGGGSKRPSGRRGEEGSDTNSCISLGVISANRSFRKARPGVELREMGGVLDTRMPRGEELSSNSINISKALRSLQVLTMF